MKVAQSCPTFCDPTDYRVHGILHARILKWVAFLFSKGSSQPRDQTQVSRIAGGLSTSWATREAQEYWSGYPIPSPVDLPIPGIEPGSSALQADSLPADFYQLVASLVAQTVKRLPTLPEFWVQSLGWEDLLEKEMATHSSSLAWKIPWAEETGRLHTVHGVTKSRTWLGDFTFTFFF